MSANTVAAYALGTLYPPNLQNNTSAIQAAGWTALIMGLIHLTGSTDDWMNAGDLHYNNTPICTGGSFVGDTTWKSGLQTLMAGGSLQTLYAAIGGWDVHDFALIQAIYQGNNQSFEGTKLQSNFKAFAAELGSVVSAIDMDVEDCYDSASFIPFCQMILDLGFKISFCPSFGEPTNLKFWGDTIAVLHESGQAPVVRVNLQCYEGGRGNDPQAWATMLQNAAPTLDTKGFIVPGANAGSGTDSVKTTLSPFAGKASVGGGFIWHLGAVFTDQDDYVGAIKSALNLT